MKHAIKHKTSKWKAVFAPIFLWSILITIGYSHGDKKHDEASEAPAVVDTTGQTNESLAMFSAALDSAYAAIGVTYSDVEPMLKNSCYDCHTTQTNFPWYFAIPGVKQFMEGHIKESKEHLDLSNGFPFGGHATQLAQLDAIKDEVEEGEMPLFSYRIMHWGKLIEGDDQKTLFAWIAQSESTIKEVYTRFGMSIPKDDHDDGDGDDDHDDDDGDDDHDHGDE